MSELPEAPHDVGDGQGPDTAVDDGQTQPDAAPAGPGASARLTAAANGLPGPAVTGRDRTRIVAARFTGGWPLGRIIGAGVLVAGLFSILAIVIGGAALANLNGTRGQVVDTLDPAATSAAHAGLLVEQRAFQLRGYALSGDRAFLGPYWAGQVQQRAKVSALRPLLSSVPGGQADLTRILAKVGAWRTTYAEPTITQVASTGKPVVSPAIYRGKAYFDSLRVTLTALQRNIAHQRELAVASLHHSASVLDATCIGIAVGLLLVLAMFAFGLWRSAILPLSRLAADARQVAGGDFGHRLDSPGGPQEVRAVGLDVNRMRERILAELSALQAAHADLEARTEDLQRSNSELEQLSLIHI